MNECQLRAALKEKTKDSVQKTREQLRTRIGELERKHVCPTATDEQIRNIERGMTAEAVVRMTNTEGLAIERAKGDYAVYEKEMMGFLERGLEVQLGRAYGRFMHPQ